MPSYLHSLFGLFLILTTWSCTANDQRKTELGSGETAERPVLQTADRYLEEIEGKLTLLQQDLNNRNTHLELIRLYRTVGQYDRALALATKLGAAKADSGSDRFAYGELLLLKGQYRQAEAQLVQARSNPETALTATLSLGLLCLETGRKTEARSLFQELIQVYQQGNARTTEAVLAVAIAAKRLERFHDANDLFGEATRLDSSNKDAFVAWGYLFVEKYNRSEALSLFEDALKIDPAYPPALVGLAEALSDSRTAQAEAKCKEALGINPNLVEAHLLLGRLALTDEDYNDAVGHFQKALEVNPNAPATRALLAACYQAMGKQAQYETECNQVLAINPGYGQLYGTIAENLSRRYRFREAIEMGRKAIALDPELWDAYASLGINLSRVGEETEGRKYLDEAFSHDPFNTWTYNTLNLFDTFENYTSHSSEHFLLKLSKEEDPVYGQQALTLLEEAYRTVAPKYGFSVSRPVLVELFPKHDDFAVRISGLPGAGALLGVCFGEVVVADSPKARPAGSFNWGQTLWHEFAHVIHLQLTRNRIPRWLAEGIAVYEAKLARPEWGIDLDSDFAAAVEKKRLLKVSELNSGFTRPKSVDQVILSYYQASIVVEFIIERYGFDAIKKMLRMYNDDKPTDEIIKAISGGSFMAFDDAFFKYAEKRTEATRKALRFTPPKNKELTESDLRELAKDQPESFYANLFLGQALQKAGKMDDAIVTLTKARTLLPSYVHDGNPYQLLTELYQKKGDDTAAIQELERLTVIDEDDIEACKTLALLYTKQLKDDGAIRALTRAVLINPFDSKVRNLRGSAYERQHRYDLAVPEFEAALAVETTDKAVASYNLARVYLGANRRSDAKRAALQALEIAPNYEAAQDILLKSVE